MGGGVRVAHRESLELVQQTERVRERQTDRQRAWAASASVCSRCAACWQRLSATALERASVLSSAFPLVLFLFLLLLLLLLRLALDSCCAVSRDALTHTYRHMHKLASTYSPHSLNESTRICIRVRVENGEAAAAVVEEREREAAIVTEVREWGISSRGSSRRSSRGISRKSSNSGRVKKGVTEGNQEKE